VPFRIPALGVAETRTYITLLLVEAEFGPEHAGFRKLLGSAREDMRRPWLSKGITSQVMNDAMGGQSSQAGDQAMVLAAQLTAMLAEGTRGNPRQIKRFLNSMLLRKEIGEARGFPSMPCRLGSVSRPEQWRVVGQRTRSEAGHFYSLRSPHFLPMQ